ncbi:MAG: RNA polymerase sigma factor RpoD/SigA [Candidatus Marinimicrobia bacterium]|nr:RNA polymerase sigma factor RpoD/SigA [Candidatus Neomarinimicrobiota bacterium]TFB10196.1 RNA polymerase sigma factor RpoD/SigA [Candidatus Marinimicrobia bacterium MT.SAG.2]
MNACKIKEAKVEESYTLDRYFDEISKESLLKPDEEIALAKKVRSGDESALEKMTRANLRFVVSIAKRYQNQGLSLGDLINEGNLGLIKAAKRFDETRGFKFISYAVWWIRQSILQALAEQSRVVRLPLNRVGVMNKVNRTLGDLEQKYEREPTAEEVAEVLEMTSVDVSDTIQMSSRHLSVDAPFSGNDENSLLDVLRDDGSYSEPDSPLIEESLKMEVDKVLSSLSEREAEVIRLYFGLVNERSMTLEEIGDRFKLTRERVRQIKEKSIRKLRHTSRSKNLRSYLG